MEDKNQKNTINSSKQGKKDSNLFAGLFKKKNNKTKEKDLLSKESDILSSQKEEKPKGSSLIDQTKPKNKKTNFLGFLSKKKKKKTEKITAKNLPSKTKEEKPKKENIPETKDKKPFFSFLNKKEKVSSDLQKKQKNTSIVKEDQSKTEEKSENKKSSTVTSEENKIETTKPQVKSAKNLLAGLFQKNEKNKENLPKKEKGEKNLFVDLFPQEANTKDEALIETIVEQSDKKDKQSILGQKLHNKKAEEKPQSNTTAPAQNDSLFLSYFTIALAIIIPLTIYLFFYFHITPSSSILDTFGVKNTGMLYGEKTVKKEKLVNSIEKIKTDITKLESTSPQVLMEQTIAQIQNDSIDWLLVMDHIKEVTNKGVRYNDLLKRVQYSSYNFQKKDNSINLSAEISDPNKQVFTLATSLIDAINTSIYFTGMENRNFNKSINEEGAKMNLSMDFTYIPKDQREDLTTVLEK